MGNRTKGLFFAVVAAFVPGVTLAADSSLTDVINNFFRPLVAALIPVVFGIALLGFLWGLAMFVWSAGNEKKRSDGKTVMIWSVLAIFILYSVVGIVNLLRAAAGIQGNPVITPPDAVNPKT